MPYTGDDCQDHFTGCATDDCTTMTHTHVQAQFESYLRYTVTHVRTDALEVLDSVCASFVANERQPQWKVDSPRSHRLFTDYNVL